MMNAINHSPCRAKASLVIRCSAGLLSIATLVAAQSRIIRPAQSNSNSSTRQQHTATLRSNDSPEGSRVAINSNQSLSDYEAYRRGDRFYVKIPPADVPRAETMRGRGYADVKVSRAADSTVISFRLQPGTTAHVEQRANKLEVVFNSAGAASVSGGGTATRAGNKPNANSRDLARVPTPSNSNRQPSNSQMKASNSAASASKGVSDHALTSPPGKSDKSGSKVAPESNASKSALATAVTPTPKPSATPSVTPQQATTKPTVSPSVQTTPTNAAASSENSSISWQSRLKERARYLILLAQLNPVPVVVGAIILALLILLFMFQRRRLKATRRVRVTRGEATKTPSGAITATPAAKAATLANVAATTAAVAAATSTAPVQESEPAPIAPDRGHHARVTAVAEQVKNVIAGGDYEESVIGSGDRETRQLVGAELLSALVGRNLQRRERARAVFMNHGYFDDATRDLRTAEAPVERAAAARRLSFVHDREATPHLIAALDDPAPEVRRTAVEALMDLRDPAAIGPLNALMQTENDRKVPRTLIKDAIDACATSASDDRLPASAANVTAPATSANLPSPAVEPEREVIEI